VEALRTISIKDRLLARAEQMILAGRAPVDALLDGPASAESGVANPPLLLGVWCRKADIIAAGIASGPKQIDVMIRRFQFPPGRLLSPAVRAWELTEIICWLDTRPVENLSPLRGIAARQTEAAVARERAKRAKAERVIMKRSSPNKRRRASDACEPAAT
jgi:hypothetical protein